MALHTKRCCLVQCQLTSTDKCCEHADIWTQGIVVGGGAKRNHYYHCPTCRDRLGIATRRSLNYEIDENVRNKAAEYTREDTTESTTSFETCIEATTCSICGDVTSDAMSCSGNHNFCSECFGNYARVAFENGSGAYFREQIEKGSTSSIGELACPLFSGGHCTCASLDHQVLARFFSKEMLDLWHEALGRIAVARSNEERRRVTQAEEESKNRRTAVDVLREAVQEALSEGGSVSCPECHVHGEKDDACMHISCESCGCRWCYCCGRVQGSASGRCSTCNRDSIFLQNQSGFRFATIGQESRGYAALHEFHTRRMGFFVRQIKSSVSANLWDQLRHEHPNLLTDVPTTGRHIHWNRIDSFREPPVFGRTKARQLAWIDNAEPIVARLQQALSNLESSTDATAPLQVQQDFNNRRTAVDAPPQTCDVSSEATATETNLLIEEIMQQGGREARNLVSQILGEDTGRRNHSRRFFRLPGMGRRRPRAES